MASAAFVVSTAVPARPFSAPIMTCAFVGRPALFSTVRSRHAVLTMGVQENREDGYVIRESEFKDPDTEDDSGDGFMGEAEMDDILGVSMPDDLAGFERREIENTRSRDELVTKLKEIAARRKEILFDKRKGMGMDNVDNYLNDL